jgi:hypothetical protein
MCEATGGAAGQVAADHTIGVDAGHRLVIRGPGYALVGGIGGKNREGQRVAFRGFHGDRTAFQADDPGDRDRIGGGGISAGGGQFATADEHDQCHGRSQTEDDACFH